MAYKQKSSSPFQRNFGIGKSPVKHRVSNIGDFESGKAHHKKHYDPDTGERMKHDEEGNWSALDMKTPFNQADEPREKSIPGPGGTFTHPSGISDAQVAANEKAGMVWYEDRGEWQYPEGSGLTMNKNI